MNSTTLLQETLPWSPEIPRTILVCDSIETDGSFVLTTMVMNLFKTLERRSARVLWLSGRPVSDRQIATTLKKVGCEVGAAYLRDSQLNNVPLTQSSLTEADDTRKLIIRSLVEEVATKLVMSGNGDNKEQEIHTDRTTSSFDPESYLQQVYNDVKTWIRMGNTVPENLRVPSWIILDDVSALSTILGDNVVYCFVDSLCSFTSRHNQLERTTSNRTKKCGTIIRCSNDVDQFNYKMQDSEDKDHSGWVGAGGLANKQSLAEHRRTVIPWERCLEDLADAIIDVLPLPSGFSREAQGRLIFSETPNGSGWGNDNRSRVPYRSSTTSWNKLIINYCVQDTGVRAIRMQAGSNRIN
jgi:hypothetical protein